MSAESLALRVEAHSGAPPAGDVVLTNSGDATVRVWGAGSQWGDEALSFELLREGREVRFVRRPQRYTVNVPFPVEVPPGGAHAWSFDLGDGSWDPEAPADPSAWRGGQLVAVYEAPESPEAEEHGVWTGRMRSDPVDLGEPSG